MNNELMHYGVLGMRWGHRKARYSSSDKTRKQAKAKKQQNKEYKPSKEDELLFGKKGAQRIADRRNKGDSKRMAKGKEFARQALLGIGSATAASFIVADVTSGGVFSKAALNTGKKGVKAILNVGKKAVDSYFNTSVMDSSGNVIKRYHQSIRTLVDSSMRLTG